MADRITVRHITQEDLEAKASVHAQTRPETYQGLLQQWLVDKVSR